MRYALLILMLVGCSEEPTAWQQAMRITGEEVVAKQDKTIAVIESTRQEIVSQNEQIIDTLKIVEASLVVPRVEPGKEVIKSDLESPAKANTALASVKVATPGTSPLVASDGTSLRWNIDGDWNPDILETSAHLRTEHGIETNGMTHQEMADIHADLHEGNVTAKVKVVNRGTSCPNGRCPVPQRRGIFGRLFR